jgi:hypothetical protein
MGIVTGGSIIRGNAIPGSKPRVTKVEAVPTDANVAYSSVGGGTVANGDLAENVLTGFVYERQAGVWTRIDTL